MKISIIGLGLIGGSIGRATLAKTEHTVYGYDISESVLIKAELMNAISERGTDETLAQSDMVIISITPEHTIEEMEKICPKLKPGAIVIDTCGIKRQVIDKMEELIEKYPELHFAGVHPMAGKEFSGIEHSTSGLYEHAFIIVVPVHPDMPSLTLLKDYFLSLGAEGLQISTAEEHDKIISYTSQLPHVIASAFIKNPLFYVFKGFSAGSFRDMTRVSRLDPDLWTELFLDNKDNLVVAIEDLQKHLEEYKEAIKAGDEAQLRALLEEGTKIKTEVDAMQTQKEKK